MLERYSQLHGAGWQTRRLRMKPLGCTAWRRMPSNTATRNHKTNTIPPEERTRRAGKIVPLLPVTCDSRWARDYRGSRFEYRPDQAWSGRTRSYDTAIPPSGTQNVRVSVRRAYDTRAEGQANSGTPLSLTSARQ